MQGLAVVLGLERRAAEGHRHLRRLVVRGVQAEIRVVQALALRAAARGHLAPGEAEHVVADLPGPLRVHAGEALGEIPLHSVAVQPETRLLLRVAGFPPGLKVALGEMRHGLHRVLRLGVLRKHLVERLDRILPAGLAVRGVRRLELHLADVVDLRGRHVRLDVLLVAVLDELADRLGQLARRGRPARFRVLHEHVDRVVERAGAVALRAALRAEEEILDLVVVGLGLLELPLDLVPKHLREKIAAVRHRREAYHALSPVRVERLQLLVDVLELGKVLVDQLLRSGDVAARHLRMGLEGDGLAEAHYQVVHPQEPVGAERGLLDVCLALPGVLLGGGKLEAELRLLHAERRPPVVLERELEQTVIHGDRLVELLLGPQDLYPRVRGLLVEVHQLLRRRRHRLEELAVQLAALRQLLPRVVGVGHRDAQGPVLRRPLLLLGEHALHLVEVTKTEVALLLQHLKAGGHHGPLLLGLRDDH